ncbi:MAG: glycosyl hydrolase 115 family protein [Bryobacteraceae bacterium]|nr:glycosyl hydrolase 115 family protein [Bryobacteraceae bacterium]
MKTLLILLVMLTAPVSARFVLANKTTAAPVVLSDKEPRHLRIAINDLIEDVRKITGKTLPTAIFPQPGSLILASLDTTEGRALIHQLAPHIALELEGKHEGARIVTIGSNLLIAGSDAQGTRHGLYDFIEHDLKVDPMHRWSGIEPAPKPELAWETLDRTLKAPTFRYRGWFLNDEDLLTEWKTGGGPRDIDYPFYQQVVAPEVIDRVLEAMVRLKMNLLIGASFTDLENPAEERIVQQATRRGLNVSMHHVEPMGVSAFAFFNYWRSRGKKLEYSYSSNPEAFHEVWRHYAAKWAKYPGVVWQVGLRGIADRPIWLADKTAPTTDEGRGKLISDAIAAQLKIIREVDHRPALPVTTTLWMEGSYLFRGGHLKIPPEVTVVFTDNGPGWKWLSDFYETPREKDRTYGTYYHHAVWGYGPHLVQAISPQLVHSQMSEAFRRNGGTYAIFNVSNVREFLPGLAATSDLLWSLDTFKPGAFLQQWCEARGMPEAAPIYLQFYDAFVINEKRGTPDLLDGITLHEGERIAGALLTNKNGSLYKPRTAEGFDGAARSFSHVRSTGEEPPPQLLKRLEKQLTNLDAVLGAADKLRIDNAAAKQLFESNLVGQARILRGICRWTAALAQTSIALHGNRPADAKRYTQSALEAFEEIRAGQAANTQGQWVDWYRGDRKINLNRALEQTRKLTEVL